MEQCTGSCSHYCHYYSTFWPSVITHFTFSYATFRILFIAPLGDNITIEWTKTAALLNHRQSGEERLWSCTVNIDEVRYFGWLAPEISLLSFILHQQGQMPETSRLAHIFQLLDQWAQQRETGTNRQSATWRVLSFESVQRHCFKNI